MKEHLFRGKEIKTKKWVYGGFFEHKPSTAIGKQPETEALIIVDGNADWDLPIPISAYIVEKETVGQYTGLKDKNGDKIFEGDIVKAYYFLNDQHYVGVVEYSSEMSAYILDKHKHPHIAFLASFGIPDTGVIGNVHDTPELLEDR